jgi:hypothetical protein
MQRCNVDEREWWHTSEEDETVDWPGPTWVTIRRLVPVLLAAKADVNATWVWRWHRRCSAHASPADTPARRWAKMHWVWR